jgi:DNA polymerase-3 subunit gamma/tau
MSATLYRKYRPANWSEIAGQNHIKVTLAFEVESGRTAHAYLFSGPRGIGKTTIARILARAVNCLDRREGGEPCGKCEACLSQAENRTLDVIEIDAASHRGIDNVRDNIIENSRFAPAKLKHKVFIIDEVHMLTAEAFNALLKTLEEPPEHAIFILATTELHKVPVTIVSRCQRFDFRKIPFSELTERLHRLAEREKVKVDSKAIEAIARQADGCLRDAEGLLGKVLTLGDGKRVSYDQALVVLPRSDWQAVSGFVESLLRRDGRTALLTLDDCLEAGVELDQFASDAIELLRQLMLVKQGVSQETLVAEADEERLAEFDKLKELASLRELILATELLLEKRRDLKTAHPPSLPLELAVAKVCGGFEAADEESAVKRAPGAGRSSVAKKPDGGAQASATVEVAAKEPATATESAEPEPDPKAEEQSEEEPTKPKPKKEKAAVKACNVTIEKVRQVWGQFIRQAGESSHSLVFLLGVAEPIGVEGDCLRVGFNYEFHKDKFNQDKPKRVMQEALKQVLGEEMRLEAVTLEKTAETCEDAPASPEPVSATAPAASAGESSQDGPAVDESGSYAKPGVDALASAFGGQVIES